MEPLSARVRSEFLKNYFQFISITSDGFPISLENSVTHPLLERCEGISRRGISQPGSTNSAESSRTLVSSQSFCSRHKRMHDWCPWLSCFVILSSAGKHECQICVNIRCTRPLVHLLGALFAHLTGPLFRRVGARAYGENIWYIFCAQKKKKIDAKWRDGTEIPAGNSEWDISRDEKSVKTNKKFSILFAHALPSLWETGNSLLETNNQISLNISMKSNFAD